MYNQDCNTEPCRLSPATKNVRCRIAIEMSAFFPGIESPFCLLARRAKCLAHGRKALGLRARQGETVGPFEKARSLFKSSTLSTDGPATMVGPVQIAGASVKTLV